MIFSISNIFMSFALVFIGIPVYGQAQTPASPAPEPAQQTTQSMLRTLLEEETQERLFDIAHHQAKALNTTILKLNLMISNKPMGLSPQDLVAVRHALRTAQDGLHAASAGTRGSISLVSLITYNEQLADYLLGIVKKDLKQCKPLQITNVAKELDPEQSAALMTQTMKKLQRLELLIKDLGVTKFQRLSRALHNFDARHNISGRLKLLGFGTFAAMLFRYLQKSNAIPNAEAPAEGKAAAAAQTGLLEALDNDVIGNPPIQISRFTQQGFVAHQSLHPRPGLFGRAEFYAKPFIVLAGFATLIKTITDKFVTDMHAWKGLFKNPKEFVKINELVRNEKQTVSPIEELFLMSALEHYEPRFTFDTVVGLHEQKKELRPIINYLLNPELSEKTGTSVEKGYLFFGPTRTGKTHLAEALAGELVHKHGKKLAFLKIKGGDLRFVGIKKVLDVVKKFTPCIVFIDELDLLNLQRDQNTQLLEEFLTGMRTDDGKQVVFLAATNRIDHIDHALLQPGRFGKIITFENPSFDDRKEFFTYELHRRNITDHTRIDLHRLALETENCTYGDLTSILNHALTKSLQSRQILDYEHFESGIDVFKRKIVQSEIQIPEAERAVIATHLAGHTLAYMLLPTSEIFHKVTLLPIQKRIIEEKAWMSDLSTHKKITTFGEVFTLHRVNTAGFDSYEQKINKVKALLAGHAAEKLLLGATAYNYHEDYDAARMELEGLVFRGLKKDQLSRATLDAKADEVQQLIKLCEEQVTTFLAAHKPALEKLVTHLSKAVTLTREEVLQIIQ